MYAYTFGGKNGKKHILHISKDMFVVRLKKGPGIEFRGIPKKVLPKLDLEAEFPEADVAVYRIKSSVRDIVRIRDDTRFSVRKDPGVRFSGKVLVEADGRTIVLYTENIFIKFADRLKAETCENILKKNKLTVRQKPSYAKNSYFVSAPENTGLEIFSIASKLLNRKDVDFCHPELIRKKALKTIHPLQWHLALSDINGHRIRAGVKADEAHKLSTGRNIIIALIDDGFDTDHAEFRLKGKIVHPVDITSGTINPRPRNSLENHGTACAGVAAAAGVNASGVAPDAFLMPVRLSSNLGSIAEANAFRWAADKGADIISCSWGPADGNWADPDDPAHRTLTDLPDSTRLAIDYCVTKGRKGKGCIVTFAAGNGNEDIKYDGYAGYEKVIAVAASNDTDKRSVYSDYGQNVWCSFPSSDLGYAPFRHPEPLTNGIYTTDRTGSQGYNPLGDYTDDFGGTSSSCPGAAGTIALVLSANPELGWNNVRDIIRKTCDKIDLKGGKYNSKGRSRYYGYGKVNALNAVRAAIDLKKAAKQKLRTVKKWKSGNSGIKTRISGSLYSKRKETVK